MQPNDSPEQVLLHFVERLPPIVREVVLTRCCMAFGRLHDARNQKLFATLRAILTAFEGEMRAYTCAQMIAVVELTLLHEGERLEQGGAQDPTRADARRHGDFGLRARLVRKHWLAARAEFQGLRNDALSIVALRGMLMSPSTKTGEAPHSPPQGPVTLENFPYSSPGVIPMTERAVIQITDKA